MENDKISLTKDWRTTKRQRNQQLNVRVSAEEHQQIKDDAIRAGITTGAYARKVLVEAKVPNQSKRPSVEKETLSQLLAQIGKIGSNINQLAKSNNQGITPSLPLLEQNLVRLYQLQEEVLSVLGKRGDKS
jgi:hypothetical protein